MPIQLDGNSIEIAHIFFGLLSFIIYKSLSIEDCRKYKHLDILMVLLLGTFTAKFISILNLYIPYPWVHGVSLLLSFLCGFIVAYLERVFYHILYPLCVDLFLKLKLNSIDLDSNIKCMHLALDKLDRAIKKGKDVRPKILVEVTLKDGDDIRGYYFNHSMNDLCLGMRNNDDECISNFISIDNISVLKFIIDKKDICFVKEYGL